MSAGDSTIRKVLIEFATNNTMELREDVVMPELGLPRDLNGDGVIDSNNHANDYRVLPLCIDVEWQDQQGIRSVSYYTTLAPTESGE